MCAIYQVWTKHRSLALLVDPHLISEPTLDIRIAHIRLPSLFLNNITRVAFADITVTSSVIDFVGPKLKDRERYDEDSHDGFSTLKHQESDASEACPCASGHAQYLPDTLQQLCISADVDIGYCRLLERQKIFPKLSTLMLHQVDMDRPPSEVHTRLGVTGSHVLPKPPFRELLWNSLEKRVKLGRSSFMSVAVWSRAIFTS